jgi:hypothetical protein
MAGILAVFCVVGPAWSQTQGTILNPQPDDRISKIIQPAVYLINGTCHKADSVTVTIQRASAPFNVVVNNAPATINGGAWEYLWNVAGLADGTYGVRIRVFSGGKEGAFIAPRSVVVEGGSPGGTLSVLPSSVISNIYVGRASGAAPGGSVSLAIGLRAVTTAAGQNVIRAEMSESGSATQQANFTLERVQSDDPAANPNDNPKVTSGIPASFTMSNLTDGVRTLRVRYFQTALGVSAVYTRSVLVDMTAPELTVGAASYPVRNVAQLSGTARDRGTAASGIARVEVAISKPGNTEIEIRPAHLVYGDNPFSQISWSLDFNYASASYPEGAYNYTVTVIDNAGNRTVSGNSNFVVDKTAPTITTPFTMDGQTNGNFVSGARRITAQFSEPVNWRILDNSDPFTESASLQNGIDIPYSTTGRTAGLHTFRVIATDPNNNPVEGSFTVIIDNDRPIPTIITPKSNEFVSGTIRVAGNVREANLQGWTLLYNGATLTTGSTAEVDFSWNTTGLNVNNGPLVLRATDLAGNTNETSLSVTTDNTPPTISNLDIDGKLNGSFVKGSRTISANFSEACTFVLFDNGQSVTSSGTPVNALNATYNTAGKEGKHTFRLVVRDRAGNVNVEVPNEANANRNVFSITVDNVAPVSRINTPRSGEFIGGKGVGERVKISGSITEINIKRWQLLFNNTAIPGAEGTTADVYFEWNTAGVNAAGSIVLRVTDQAENSADSSVNVTVDNTAPTVSNFDIDGRVGGNFVKGSRTITATFSEPCAYVLIDNGVTLTSSGTPVSSISIPYNTANREGLHTFRLMLKDRAGNPNQENPDVNSPSRNLFRVVVDNIRPVAIVSTPRNGDFVAGTVRIVGAIEDLNPGTWAVEASDLTNGGSLNSRLDAGTRTGSGTVVRTVLDTEGLPVGTRILVRITATDLAGNTSSDRPTNVEPTNSVVVTVNDTNTPIVGIRLLTSPAFDINGILIPGVVSSTNTGGSNIYVGGSSFQIRGIIQNFDGTRLRLSDDSRGILDLRTNVAGPTFQFDRAIDGDANPLHSLLLIANNSNQITVAGRLRIVLDSVEPNFTLQAPVNPNGNPYVLPQGAILTVIYEATNPQVGQGLQQRDVHSPLFVPRTETLSDIYDVKLRVGQVGGGANFTYSLSQALGNTNVNDANGAGLATVSNVTADRYRIVWQIPITSNYAFGQTFELSVDNVRDVVGNKASPQGVGRTRRFRVGLN